jgi:CHAT domain-containing protein
MPPRGVTRDLREKLGAFLLPDPLIWAGTIESPQSVAIVPDPRLWQVPYAALIRGGDYLADVAEVALTPSLRTLQLLLRRVEARDAGRASEHPALSNLDSSLPGFAVERKVLDAWPGRHHAVEALAAADPRAALLYISGHGTGAGATPQFGPAAISLDALAAVRLPRLVVLNGCWSGTAASRYGQDPLSLAVGALLGGADTVVAGVGRVGSEPSARVGASFVNLVRDGVAPAAALRLAQLALRDAHPDLGPFDWAGLCAIGTGR